MTIWNTIATERRRLADELENLTDEQWNTPSQCAAWTVEDVAVHTLLPFEVSTLRFGLNMLKNRGNLDKTALDLTARLGEQRRIIGDGNGLCIEQSHDRLRNVTRGLAVEATSGGLGQLIQRDQQLASIADAGRSARRTEQAHDAASDGRSGKCMSANL